MLRLLFLSFIFINCEVASKELEFPLATSSSLEKYSAKVSQERSAFKVLRRIDFFRIKDDFINSLIKERPHQHVIESILFDKTPQISTLPVEEIEITPFYSNFFEQKFFLRRYLKSSWEDRARQRLDQFRHQTSGVSQIGSF
ncbi:MAG: hypothetical protein CME61_02230 [Halobacteriovoraceae bacterium]|nr:hypothetical protein [Halobacteriovoraceae bacterium]